MSLTKPIPEKLKQRMDADPFYHRCCITGTPDFREKVDWHHNFETYLHGNRGRLNQAWCILPVVWWIHAMADNQYVREVLDHIMLNRATDDILEHWSSYPGELKLKRDHLNKKLYGKDQENYIVLHTDARRDIPTIDF